MKTILKLTILLICLGAFASLSTSSYFSDTEISLDNCFVTETPPPPPPVADILITEVFYNPSTNKHYKERRREWIEIYNTTSGAINLQSWKIQDNSRTLTLPNISLPAHSYGIIVRYDNDTLPGGLLEIHPNDPHWFKYSYSGLSKSYLGDNGDKVVLKSPSDTIIDAMSYGNNTSIFNPACIPTAKSHSFERTSVVVDTDTAADWFDNSSPTPGH